VSELPEGSLYREYDLVTRREGSLHRVVRSRFHARGDLLTEPQYVLAASRVPRRKVLVLPEIATA
jgi:hypothetical protein